MEAGVTFLARLFGARRIAAARAPRSLADAPAGRRLRVDAVLADDPVRSDRLASLGLVEGCEVWLRQRHPAFVLDVGETTLAVDRDLARSIRVTAL
jgi:Fe2+ transport system protein FeoA